MSMTCSSSNSNIRQNTTNGKLNYGLRRTAIADISGLPDFLGVPV
jgi:hypothetical protein